jgi:hypothetical protein
MTEKLHHYAKRLREVQTGIQNKLDAMDEEKYEDLYYRREEQVDALDEILEILDELISSVEDYNCQWRGIKSIK